MSDNKFQLNYYNWNSLEEKITSYQQYKNQGIINEIDYNRVISRAMAIDDSLDNKEEEIWQKNAEEYTAYFIKMEDYKKKRIYAIVLFIVCLIVINFLNTGLLTLIAFPLAFISFCAIILFWILSSSNEKKVANLFNSMKQEAEENLIACERKLQDALNEMDLLYLNGLSPEQRQLVIMQRQHEEQMKQMQQMQNQMMEQQRQIQMQQSQLLEEQRRNREANEEMLEYERRKNGRY